MLDLDGWADQACNSIGAQGSPSIAPAFSVLPVDLTSSFWGEEEDVPRHIAASVLGAGSAVGGKNLQI
jgi:hypothetical protein